MQCIDAVDVDVPVVIAMITAIVDEFALFMFQNWKWPFFVGLGQKSWDFLRLQLTTHYELLLQWKCVVGKWIIYGFDLRKSFDSLIWMLSVNELDEIRIFI